jgi:hypothetical protein
VRRGCAPGLYACISRYHRCCVIEDVLADFGGHRTRQLANRGHGFLHFLGAFILGSKTRRDGGCVYIRDVPWKLCEPCAHCGSLEMGHGGDQGQHRDRTKWLAQPRLGPTAMPLRRMTDDTSLYSIGHGMLRSSPSAALSHALHIFSSRRRPRISQKMSMLLVGSADCILLVKNVPGSCSESDLLARCESIGHSWFDTCVFIEE